ncbi:hypothetical protein A2422_03040 [Candidatus Woesebacteria bacterium RIFOXYC1_FULL_31_51]|nr:MAG: hypothetical protein UR17_C0001G0113 [Candidatus Woesebacteria bacterium GW2011_GWF1_31_35]KKP23393.1 MAG: hypothetical protein UR11_C0001G0367 [Candidatus Woesebacteria bacterium GW2011_GWC1_30_29]KKP25203.1 MAG: hypothetical protein UR13_C0010G0005 [Candidatus Woesebacteria bacterium GW2011_GWD1_31_12]KKP27652.1 MAG: hypothetical protein UR16_C0003G0312 [Candidatus Woesebacteria bacterium GW2011_GWB1_31_29]KKP34291.1 MAG: hypothetical protein UR24_C0001G0356 [Candidatus Woesebacteria 
MANYNVTKNSDGGWDAKRDNAQRSSFHGNTQRETETVAKQFSKNSCGGEVRIQGRDNKFRDSDTVPPAHDPNPPRDKRH